MVIIDTWDREIVGWVDEIIYSVSDDSKTIFTKIASAPA